MVIDTNSHKSVTAPRGFNRQSTFTRSARNIRLASLVTHSFRSTLWSCFDLHVQAVKVLLHPIDVPTTYSTCHPRIT